MLKIPPRSIVSQVLPCHRCRKRRPSTLSRTALGIAKQPQAPRDAASGQNNNQVKTLDH
jgi:hypothetical protein